KASVVSRIESGKMVPDLKLARKFEKIMNIVLIEKTDNVTADEIGHKKTRGATIGDIARIKKN
ncbi:MAG TPA: TIGR00270 family protein, partial [Methanobacterium sp.]|nr:TIGR00270 family protein [Methanobacterium sp.]